MDATVKRLKYSSWLLLLMAAAQLGAFEATQRNHSAREGLAYLELAAKTQYRLPALGSSDSRSANQKTGSANGSSDFTFATVDVRLDGDYDGDGYYYAIDLEWDADTSFSSADVYTVVWISYEGDPWEEFLTSSVYTLNGASSADRYRIESELESGYPSGSYDLLLELYDPDSGALLADLGPWDAPALSQLPLEDIDFDADEDDHYHGGSLNPLLVAGLLLALVRYRQRFSARRVLRHG